MAHSVLISVLLFCAHWWPYRTFVWLHCCQLDSERTRFSAAYSLSSEKTLPHSLLIGFKATFLHALGVKSLIDLGVCVIYVVAFILLPRLSWIRGAIALWEEFRVSRLPRSCHLPKWVTTRVQESSARSGPSTWWTCIYVQTMFLALLLLTLSSKLFSESLTSSTTQSCP